MRELKILFMGTPDFSVPMLDAIYNSDNKLVGVVTAVDKPAGRGRKLNKSAVKKYAEKNKITLLQPKNLKSDDFYAQLQALNPNLIVVIAFRMLPQKVWSFPEFGTFNLHASLLPDYRGAAPINWSIINGETTTGLTTFFIDEKIDTGEIIDSKQLPIHKTDNSEKVYHKMIPLGTQLVMSTIESIKNNKITTRKQPKSAGSKHAPKLTKKNTQIDWTKKGEKIYNLVRGLSPYPMAWCILDNGQKYNCKISKVNFLPELHTHNSGNVFLKNNQIYVAVEDGYIAIEELKLEGKKLLKAKDLLNGLKLKPNARMVLCT